MSRIIIGLTGNIATGKSAVMKLAAERGALTIDADQIVHELLDGDPAVQDAVTTAFGAGVRRADGRIDRVALGQIVFSDPEALRRLEAILHPAVRLEAARRIGAGEAPVVMLEAIKLLEGGLAAACHQIWVTVCSPERQLERLRVYRGMDEETARRRIAAQSPQAEKAARADVVIDTDGPMRRTEEQFAAAWARLPAPVN